jgi:hypothetical protein
MPKGKGGVMTQNVWFIAAIWMALAFSASLISIWAGISVALVEILVGLIAGNFLGIHATTDWINFLALLGSGVLTFLAGAEIDPRSLKANLRASGLIGVLSFGAIRDCLGIRAIRPRLAAPAGADRWSRTLDYVGCCRLRSDDRRRL